MTPIEVLRKFDNEVDYDRAKSCENKEKAGDECYLCLQEQYFSGRVVAYDCIQLQYIYVLRYLLAHLKENLEILEGLNQIGIDNNWEKPIEVLTLGGGPGSEIAALQIFIENCGFFGAEISEIYVTCLDRVKDWSEIFMTVRKISQGNSVKYNYERIVDDVCAVNEYKGNYDLVFLSYVISELTDEIVDKLIRSLMYVVKKHKFILIFNDRQEDVVINRIERIVSSFSITGKYFSKENVHIGMSYPDDIQRKVRPKLHLNSYRLGVVFSS